MKIKKLIKEKIKKITGFNKEEEDDKNKNPPKTKKKRTIKNLKKEVKQ